MATIGAASSSLFSACARPFGEETTPPSRPTERKRIYVQLPQGLDDRELALEIGERSYRLERYDAATRAQHRAEHPYASTLTDEQLGAFVKDAEFSAESPQIFAVTHRTKGAHAHGARGLVLAGIHIPQAGYDAARALMGPDWHPKPGELRAMRTRLGSTATFDDEDLNVLVDPLDAAHFTIYHHPELLSLDSATAAIVLSIIDDLAEVEAVKEAIVRAGVKAQGPDSDYEGWANGQYALDFEGKRIPALDAKGNEVLDDAGQRVWDFDWIPDKTVQQAAGAAIRKALRRVRDTAQLENRRWIASDGLGSVRSGAFGAAAAPYTVALANDRKVQYGQSVRLDSVVDDKVTLEVVNTYVRHLSVGVAFKDVDGRILPIEGANSTWKYLGLLPPAGRIFGVPNGDYPSGKFEITLPPGASQIALLTGSGATSAGDWRLEYDGIEAAGDAMTWTFEIGFPMLLLAMGGVTSAVESKLAKLATVFVPVVVQTATEIGLSAKLNAATGPDKPKIAVRFIKALFKAMRAVRQPTNVEALGEQLAEIFGETAAQGVVSAIPLIGWCVWAFGAATTAADIIETTADIALSRRCVETVASFSHALRVSVKPDPGHAGRFPDTAKKVHITAMFSKSNTHETPDLPFDPTSSGPVFEHTFPESVPTGGHVTVNVVFLSETGWIAGQGHAVVDNVVPAGSDALVVEITITQNQVPLSTATKYFHQRKLVVDGSASPKHAWKTTASAPTATRGGLDCRDGAAALCSATSITYNSTIGQVAYAFEAAAPKLGVCGESGNTGVQVYMLQSLNDSPLVGDGSPDARLEVLSCGYLKPVHIVYDLVGGEKGQHFVLIPAATGYTARKITLGPETNFATIEQLPIYGTFASDNLASVRYHTSGYLVAINADFDKIEVLHVADAPPAAGQPPRAADLLGGRGKLKGLTDGAVAIACAFTGRTFLVLEAGNRRLQAFDDNGNPTLYFGAEGQEKSYFAQLRDDEPVTYLDVAMEATGYIYVLSFAGDGGSVADYRLDIYDPVGRFLARTAGMAAAKLAVDLWRNVFTLNYETIIGPNARTEPSLSQWIPSTPEG